MQKNSPAREIEELSLLYNISHKLGESMDLKAVLSPILMMIADHLQVPRATLTILNRNTGEITTEEASGLLPEEQAKGTYRPGEGITGMVIKTGKAVIVSKVSDEPLFLNKTGARKNLAENELSFICVPVKIGYETIGALSVDRVFREGDSLREVEHLLTIIAASISQAVRLRQLAGEELEKLKEENARLHDELRVRHGPKTMIGNSRKLQTLFALIDKVSRANTTVLILGESGVGKERVAHAIHYSSQRADQPFIKVNCAALPESLIESELFGHEKGAFTGATAFRKGRFELAGKGSIFLDEIGELSLALQAKLLRVLQEKEFERIGGNITLKADARVIVATNKDLETLIREGRFREDLYYRLNVFPIVVPPLRDRKEDINALCDHFIVRCAAEHGKEITGISPTARDLLMNHAWPGNVRELENCIERAVILCTQGTIQSYHLSISLSKGEQTGLLKTSGTLKETLTGVEKGLITEELKRCRGNMARAARALGITERMMGLRIARLGIDPRLYK